MDSGSDSKLCAEVGVSAAFGYGDMVGFNMADVDIFDFSSIVWNV